MKNWKIVERSFENKSFDNFAAEVIGEISGLRILVFTGDSTFLYSVIKWTVNVTRAFIGWRCFISESRVSGFQVSRCWISGFRVSGSGPDFRLCHFYKQRFFLNSASVLLKAAFTLIHIFTVYILVYTYIH